jgi:GntR family transcriptional regulator/MocR family aminotransferase
MLFRSAGLRVTGVPVDESGLVVDDLPEDARLVYATPSHQFPLGVSMSISRRLDLLAWAQRHDAAIVEDDYDSEFRYADRPVESLHALDSRGRVIYVGSFSKTMLPTLRLGFLVTPPALRSAVGLAKFVADWHTELPLQAALARFIEDGDFARHLRRMRTRYWARHESIKTILAHDFTDLFGVVPSVTGLHLTAISRSLSARRLAAAVRGASALGVEAQELVRFAVEGLKPPTGLVLGYGAIPTERIPDGLRILRQQLDAATRS